MKKAFLDGLKGRTTVQAEAMIQAAGFVPYLVPVQCVAITAEAKPNTVVIWQEPEGIVKQADAGDPTELEDFAYHP